MCQTVDPLKKLQMQATWTGAFDKFFIRKAGGGKQGASGTPTGMIAYLIVPVTQRAGDQSALTGKDPADLGDLDPAVAVRPPIPKVFDEGENDGEVERDEVQHGYTPVLGGGKRFVDDAVERGVDNAPTDCIAVVGGVVPLVIVAT